MIYLQQPAGDFAAQIPRNEGGMKQTIYVYNKTEGVITTTPLSTFIK
jgi:hypothetical protein